MPSGRLTLGPVDRIIVATGQRPDLDMTRELRLDLDPWLESPRALGPSIDPNLHSCGSVPPHGYRELAHPEPGYFAVGIKSYGRAPTFLLATGYEQVRRSPRISPATKRPRTMFGSASRNGRVLDRYRRGRQECCGGPRLKPDACCAADATAKAAGKSGCGCG